MKLSKDEKDADEKTAQIEIVREKLPNGAITAISIDTCILSANHNRLEDALLKRLEQFKNGGFRLIFLM